MYDKFDFFPFILFYYLYFIEIYILIIHYIMILHTHILFLEVLIFLYCIIYFGLSLRRISFSQDEYMIFIFSSKYYFICIDFKSISAYGSNCHNVNTTFSFEFLIYFIFKVKQRSIFFLRLPISQSWLGQRIVAASLLCILSRLALHPLVPIVWRSMSYLGSCIIEHLLTCIRSLQLRRCTEIFQQITFRRFSILVFFSRLRFRL